MGAVTFVERTTRTSALVSPSAVASASSFSPGSKTTSQPAAARPSRPDGSNGSATRTFIGSRSPSRAVDVAASIAPRDAVHGPTGDRKRDRRGEAVPFVPLVPEGGLRGRGSSAEDDAQLGGAAV